ncbi:hypothetical protein D7X87_15165 [bacterium D16-54]|nr:hypothetical protein D7X87_15165 [bacterium D16-54]RKJ13581.1 hypothetical protein D7X65_15670 [bacterium D16-56]
MNLNQILELSMVLDNEHFQKVFPRLYKGEGYIVESREEYIDQSLSSKGITVIYRDSQYKKKIRLIVNTYLLADDVSDIDRLTRKLDKRITEYFNGKYRIDDFTLSGINFIADMDVGTRANAMAYLKVFQRIGRVKGFSPISYECFDDNVSFCLSGNSNGIEFLLYDLEKAFMRQLKSANADWKKLKPIKGILRAEVRLMKPKAVRAYTDADDASGQIADLLKGSRNIFLDTFIQIIPFGDFYKKDKAVEIIRKEVADSIMRRRMLRLLVLIPEKKSLHLAQKSMNCRNMEKIMDAFAKISLSPVTISKRHDVKYLECLYTFLLN